MSQPLRIYLDSGDWSALSDRGREGARSGIDELFQYLEGRVVAGDIIVPFTQAHLAELIRSYPENKDLANRKAETIERLSQGLTLPSVMHLFAFDLIRGNEHSFSRSELQNIRYTNPIRGGWLWTPPLGTVLDRKQFDIEGQYRAALLKRAKTRKERRLVNKMAKEILLNTDWTQARNTAETYFIDQFGFSNDEMISSFLDFSKGRISISEFESIFVSFMARPTNFLRLYFDFQNGDRKVLDYMVTASYKFNGRIVESLEKLAPVRAAGFAVPDDWLEDFRPDVIIEKLDYYKEGSRLSKFFPYIELPNKKKFTSNDHIYMLCELHRLYLKDVLSDRNATKPKRSDFVDWIHALYAPFVDVWRGDGYSANLAKKAFKGLRTEFSAGSPPKLQNQIERLLSEH